MSHCKFWLNVSYQAVVSCVIVHVPHCLDPCLYMNCEFEYACDNPAYTLTLVMFHDHNSCILYNNVHMPNQHYTHYRTARTHTVHTVGVYV